MLATIASMANKTTRHRQNGVPSAATGQEALYLRLLSEKQLPVNVKLRDGEVVFGWIEYFDDTMIRLTREGKPNLFIYKQQIRTISELVRKDESKRRTALRKGVAAPAASSESSLAGSHASSQSQRGGDALLANSTNGEMEQP